MWLSSLFNACTGFPLCSAEALPASSTQVLLPKPTGLYQVGRSVAEATDKKRTQPFAPVKEFRKLMISVFYPVVPQHPSVAGAYMPPETALIEDSTLSSFGLKASSDTFEIVYLNLASNKPTQNLPHQPPCHYPLAPFTSAEGTTCLFYNQDVSFVLDSLSNTTLAHSLVPNLPPSGLNTKHTAMFAHSLGGASAFSKPEADARALGGLDIDGSLYGPGLAERTSQTLHAHWPCGPRAREQRDRSVSYLGGGMASFAGLEARYHCVEHRAL